MNLYEVQIRRSADKKMSEKKGPPLRAGMQELVNYVPEETGFL
jgi:hypothetical protein